MVQPQHTDLIAAYLAGELSADERAKLMAWVDENPSHRVYFEELLEIWSASEDTEVSDYPVSDQEAAWDRLEDRLFGQASAEDATPIVSLSPKRVRSSPWKWISVAASIALLLGVGSYLLRESTGEIGEQIVLQSGSEKQQLTLPDGSNVWLNAQSELTYTTPFDRRDVTLEGEAFFDVVPNAERPFRIRTAETVTTVLGTSFNVRAYPEETSIEVTVSSGKVKLEKPDSPGGVNLEKGQTGVYDRSQAIIERRETTIAEADAWRTGRLSFVDTPLSEALPGLERFYGLKIEVSSEAIRNCRLNLKSAENTPLDSVLKMMSFLLNVDIEQQQNTVRLLGKGCE